MRAILIDPTTETVTEIEVQKFKDLYRICECTMVEAVRMPAGHQLWLDEEGLLKPEPKPFFQVPWYPQPLCGKAVLLGTDARGEIDDAEPNLVGFELVVSFPNVRFVGFHDTESIEDHPIFGPVNVFRREAKFEEIQ